jgi:hypothetical protein
LIESSTKFKIQKHEFNKIYEYYEILFSNDLKENSLDINIHYIIEINFNMFPITPPRVYLITNVNNTEYN